MAVPFDGTGTGRCWPLLTGERGHCELAAGRDAVPYIRAMEKFANEGGMLPEQVWDGPPLPEARMQPGAPTGAAMPLCWAHAEYLTLIRSAKDGCGFDCLPQVKERYSKTKRVISSRFGHWVTNHGRFSAENRCASSQIRLGLFAGHLMIGKPPMIRN